MKLKKPKHNHYCANVVEISNFVPLEGCDNVKGAIIMSNQVIVSKNQPSGQIGLFFPTETALSSEFLSNNNLYRISKSRENLNIDKENSKGGFFESHGRIRCIKLRGHNSEGFFIPIESLEFIKGFDKDSLLVGDEFDEILGMPICEKYIPKATRMPGVGGGEGSGKKPKVSKIVDGQFHFHKDTSQLYKNLHKIKPENLISISYKVHGTSGISSNVLCKRKLSIIDKVAKLVGVNVIESEYDFINSSRKVIKNGYLNDNPSGYYSENIWGMADEVLRPYLSDSQTLYYEIIGYMTGGAMIQKGYDYGFEPPKVGEKAKCGDNFGIQIYRCTFTSPSGKVTEMSAKWIQNWTKSVGLVPVNELWYGYAREFSDERLTEKYWQDKFIETIKERFNDKKCFMSKNNVFEEGCVIRLEDDLGFTAFKQKSPKFYLAESKQLDSGEVDIESSQS